MGAGKQTLERRERDSERIMMTVNMMAPVLRNTTDAALRSDDPRLIGDALPTSLLLLEGMLETNPGQQEIATLVREKTLLQTPIKTEHAGAAIGSVVSAHVTDAGKLQCVMELDEQHAAGAVVRGFIRDGLAPELSLGYVVDVTHSSNRLQAGAKYTISGSAPGYTARSTTFVAQPGQRATGSLKLLVIPATPNRSVRRSPSYILISY